jgi:hypothetical protein
VHIHGGHMNPNVSTGGAQAALAARRAEETRKKLFASSAEIDALSTGEGAWMVNAWAGGGSGGDGSGHNSRDSSGHGQGYGQALEPQALNQASSQAASQGASLLSSQALPIVSSSAASPAYGDEVQRTPPTGPVSFWA